jgi:hypothetical protein
LPAVSDIIPGGGGGVRDTEKIKFAHFIIEEPGSSVSIVSGYGLDYRAIEVRSPAKAKGFFL